MKSIHQKLGLTTRSTGKIPIIDAHHHLWNLDSHYYPWLAKAEEFFLGDYAAIRKNYLPKDYLKDTQNQMILATVHCEADHDYANEVEETKWVYQQSQEFGFPNAILPHVWFHLNTCEKILAEHTKFPTVRGIRSKPVTAKTPELKASVYGTPGSMQDKNWLAGFALLEKFNLSWDLRVPYWHLDEAANVARSFPDTKIILNHTGFPWDRSEKGLNAWRQGMQDLSSCPNVWVKISELGLLNDPWTVDINRGVILETIDMFGIDRCVFASNFPVSKLRISYDDLVAAMLTILKDFSQEDKEKFFWHNAKQFYRIDLEL